MSVLSGVKRRSRRAGSAVAFCHRTLCVQSKIIHAGTLSGEGKELWPCICADSLTRFLPKLKYFNDTFAVFWNSWPSICRQSERASFIFSFAYLQIYKVKRIPWSKSVGEGKIVRAIRPHDKWSQIADLVGQNAKAPKSSLSKTTPPSSPLRSDAIDQSDGGSHTGLTYVGYEYQQNWFWNYLA